MSDRNCPPLLAGIVGFVLGVVAVKLAERFCPFCRTACCCGDEAECCGERGRRVDGCCCGATSSDEEADSSAE